MIKVSYPPSLNKYTCINPKKYSRDKHIYEKLVYYELIEQKVLNRKFTSVLLDICFVRKTRRIIDDDRHMIWLIDALKYGNYILADDIWSISKFTSARLDNSNHIEIIAIPYDRLKEWHKIKMEKENE